MGRRGQGFLYFVILLVVGGILLYFARGSYNERYYITLYDDGMVRYLEIPPFATRKTPVSYELAGCTVLEIGIAPDQAMNFLSGMCGKKGFIFRQKKDGFDIEITRQYLLSGLFGQGSNLILSWKPRLPEKLRGLVPTIASGTIPVLPVPKNFR